MSPLPPWLTFLNCDVGAIVPLQEILYIFELQGHWTDDGKKWEPSNEEWTMIVIVIAFNVLILLNFWIILSCFASLQMVVAAGGTGFEMQNYKEIKAGRNVKSGESSALTEDESV